MISIKKTYSCKQYKIGLVGAFMLILSACSIIPKSQPLSVYRLDAPSNIQTTQALVAVDESLKISTPYSSGFINSNKILVRTDAGEINAYQGARWSDSAPTMLRDYLIEYFRDNGQIKSVVNDSFSISSAYTLEIDLRRFEAAYQGNTFIVNIDFDAILVNNRTHKTISVKNFKDQKQATSTDIASIVKQFNASSQSVANDLLLWSSEQISTLQSKQ